MAMTGGLNSYGYSDKGVMLISSKAQEEEKQSEKDEGQNVRIANNASINDKQSEQIKELYDLIESIPSSGGTVTDLDMGGWS